MPRTVQLHTLCIHIMYVTTCLLNKLLYILLSSFGLISIFAFLSTLILFSLLSGHGAWMSVLKNSVNKTNLGAGSFQADCKSQSVLYFLKQWFLFSTYLQLFLLSAVSSSPKFLFVFGFLRRCIIETVHSKWKIAYPTLMSFQTLFLPWNTKEDVLL